MIASCYVFLLLLIVLLSFNARQAIWVVWLYEGFSLVVKNLHFPLYVHLPFITHEFQ
jgi:hypothetical protein